MTGSDELRAYVDALFGEPPLLAELREALDERGFPTIQVPTATGRLLELVSRMTGARRVLELGTLGGYSALWLLRGMPDDGRLLTVEREPDHAELAREFFRRAGVADRVDLRLGEAGDVVSGLEPGGSMDLVFVDADKEGYVRYLDEAARLLRPGGVVLADNALWRGQVVAEGVDEVTDAIRAFNRTLAESASFRATILPVGDGVALGVRTGD